MATTTTSTKRKKSGTTRAKTTKTKAKKPAKTAVSRSKVTTKKVAPVAVVSTETTTSTNKAKTTKKPKVFDRFKNLNSWNWAMFLLHLVQGIAVVVLSKNALFPVTTDFVTLETIASEGAAPSLVPATRQLFDVNLAYIVAAFFFMSAIAHLVIATVYRKKYEANLQKGINKARWYEYGISASTMMIGIAMLVGVTDLSTFLLIFGTTLVMNLCGLIMEIHNQTTEKTSWLSFNIGTLSGILPWVVIALYFWGASTYGAGDIPTFVYYIYASMFVFFSSFAVNMYLQYKKKGRWADYLYGEKAYMVLSLVAKSVLAWQVFAGSLRP